MPAITSASSAQSSRPTSIEPPSAGSAGGGAMLVAPRRSQKPARLASSTHSGGSTSQFTGTGKASIPDAPRSSQNPTVAAARAERGRTKATTAIASVTRANRMRGRGRLRREGKRAQLTWDRRMGKWIPRRGCVARGARGGGAERECKVQNAQRRMQIRALRNSGGRLTTASKHTIARGGRVRCPRGREGVDARGGHFLPTDMHFALCILHFAFSDPD
jgi:hypothetical protein